MRALIIGTSGQLATELRQAPLPDGIELHPSVKVDLSDAEELEVLLERANPQLIVNAGAYTAVERAETDERAAFAVNADGPAVLARWCERRNAALVHVSTDYVFDGTKATPYVEEDATNPVNVYGASKLAGEVAVRERLQRHFILRTSWVFSAHGNNFVKTMLRLAGERDELRVVADQRGRPTPAAELASCVWRVAAGIAAGDDGRWGTYHVAGTGVASWWEFAQAIVEEQRPFTGRAPIVTPIDSSAFASVVRRPATSILDTTRFERTFGIALTPWQVGLHRVVAQLFSRPAG